MKTILFLIIFFYCGTIFSQNYFPSYYDTTIIKSEITFQGKADLINSSINNQFVNHFLWGGTISEEEAKNNSNKQQTSNKLQLESNTELEYRNYQIFPKSMWGIIVKGGVYYSLSTAYTNSLFNLSLFGNTDYLNQTLSLGPCKINSVSYSKFGFGIIHKKSKNNFSLNIYEIYNQLSLDIKKGNLIFNNTGSNLTLNDIDLNFSTFKRNNNTHSIGVGIDLDLKIPITTFFERQLTLQILTKNLGIGLLTQNVTNYNLDTSYQYSGMSISGIKSFISNHETQHFLDTLSVQKTTDSKWIALPGYLQAGKINLSTNTNRFQSYYGCRIYPNFSFLPLLYSGIQFKMNKFIYLGLSENYGIINQFRTGMFIRFNLKSISMTLGSENIISSFRSNGNGQSYQFRIACQY